MHFKYLLNLIHAGEGEGDGHHHEEHAQAVGQLVASAPHFGVFDGTLQVVIVRIILFDKTWMDRCIFTL